MRKYVRKTIAEKTDLIEVRNAGVVPPMVVRYCTLVPDIPHKAPPSRVKNIPMMNFRLPDCMDK